jgi:hypothetical protein
VAGPAQPPWTGSERPPGRDRLESRSCIRDAAAAQRSPLEATQLSTVAPPATANSRPPGARRRQQLRTLARRSPRPRRRTTFARQPRVLQASRSPSIGRSLGTTSGSPGRDFRSATPGAGFEARRNARMTIGPVEPGHWRRSDDAHATRSGLEGAGRFGRDPSCDVPNNRAWRSLRRRVHRAWRLTSPLLLWRRMRERAGSRAGLSHLVRIGSLGLDDGRARSRWRAVAALGAWRQWPRSRVGGVALSWSAGARRSHSPIDRACCPFTRRPVARAWSADPRRRWA